MTVRQIGDCTLILGDCLQVMPTIDVCDLLLTDPPFGIGRDKGMGVGGKCFSGIRGRDIHLGRYAGAWDKDRPAPEVFAAMREKSRQQIIWGGQFFADLLPPQGKWLWWDKCQTMPSYGDGELAWTNLSGDAPKKFVYSNNGLMAREKDRVHPTQKPVALMEWCLGFAPNAETVLDCFMGSGTTLVACAKLGRKGVGIEIDPDYFETACKRVADAYRQPDMFIPAPTKPIQESMF